MNALNRCRLVIVLPGNLLENPLDAASQLKQALSGGDVASVIIPFRQGLDQPFQTLCETLVPLAQNAGAAAIIANDTQTAGRCNADGIHLDLPGGNVGVPILGEAIEKYTPAKIVGAGNVKTRHMGLCLGEAYPDYLFFGNLNGDTKPEPHPKMLALAEWWAQMVEIPGICLGGQELESVIAVAQTGIDFVALSSAIFSHEEGSEQAVKKANLLLDEHAPDFDDDADN
jgi:thiamine-phosphate pyrophosphorylase